jgi:phosphatidylglycerol:prolipoprotein diacylglycerol transferase|tara:strand:- start:238 stop:1047 length:810 start_codon:yes stop_codon:yes gene_type:complete
MIVHNFDPVLVDFGLFQIRWYSLAYILGIIIGWAYANKVIKLTTINKYNFEQIKELHFSDLIIYLVVGMVLGGRLGYVFFYNFEYYSQNIFQIFKLWQGGMSFHGGLLGVIVSIFIFSKKIKKNFFKFSDIISCVAPIGIFLGRVANFINGELYGKVSTLPWAVVFKDAGSLGRHPSQIYEAILEGIILFILINYLALKKKLLFKPGYISSFFLILYSILRIFSENYREPDIHIGYFFNYFSMGTILSFITFMAGCFIIFLIKRNEQNN